jgi:hypothetical protein
MSELPKEFRPHGVDRYRKLLRQGLVTTPKFPKALQLASNVSYSFQYLEFLANYHRSYDHHFTINALLVKDFVVVGCGILEAVFYYLIRVNGWEATSEFELVKELRGNPFEHSGETLSVVTRVMRKLPEPALEQMTFDQMTKKLEKKHIFRNEGIYPKLSALRRLRNNVHLQNVADGFTATDFNAFGRDQFEQICETLYLVFTSNVFSATDEQKELLSFLRP